MRYAELHCKTNFSFLLGASHADELVDRAIELGYEALAITDQNSLAGVVRAHAAARDKQLKLLIGSELHLEGCWPLVVWVTDRSAYARLCRLLTLGRRRAPKGQCWLRWEDLAAHADGLLAGLAPPHPSTASHLASGRAADAASTTSGMPSHWTPREAARQLAVGRELFGDRLWLLAECYQGPDDRAWLRQLQSLAAAQRVPLAAAGDVHYHHPRRMPLWDVLAAIRLGTTVDQLGARQFANARRHLKSVDDLASQFADLPDALAQTAAIADRCSFSLAELRYEYPEELAPHGMEPMQYLRQLTWQGAAGRYPQGIPDKVRGLLDHELELIAELHYEAYFLTVWDLVRFARRRGILCQGRGSAANSAVCYCLEVTAVDPAQSDLLFERFVSRERDEAPDIDVDFEHERREEVLQYLYDKYGRDRAGLAAEVVSYRCRSAIRDVGKALGLSLDRVDALAKQVEGYSQEEHLADRCRQVGLDPDSECGRRLLHLVPELIGFPRHLSQHVGGMVMTRGPLSELVPIENAAMADRTVLSWDKNDLDTLGILKVDCLSLGMLTAIRKAFALVHEQTGQRWTLASIPADDALVYDMISRADTMGVFQIESRAQMSMLPRLRPQCYYDLVVEVAIVRPGPIQGQMVHPYLRRRMGLESVEYPNEAIREVLHKTLGVPIFQEQAMRLAVVAAGFTPGQADQLRRAMGAWRSSGVIETFRQKLVEGMRARGLPQEFAEQVFLQIRGFGEYGFPESHAASFALLVYISAWLKHHHPAAFTAALINSQPMGFYAPSQLIRDARQHGVTVLPIDINASHWDCTLEPQPGSGDSAAAVPAIRLGFRLIRGLSEADARKVVQARGQQPYRSLQELARRTGLGRAVLMRLSEADAMGSLGRSRRDLLWESLAQERSARELPLLDRLAPRDDDPVELPPMDSLEQVFADYDATGLSLKAHPMAFYRESLGQLGVVPAEQLSLRGHEARVRVAGLVLMRQRPSTAKGITFVTLEDETGTINLVVRQAVWEQFYTIARRSSAWIAHGQLESRYSVLHVVVYRIEDLASQLRGLRTTSRDFR
jgi:error-prone DNA polymerase